ncbi:MAG: response regulator transcription factor [Opitutaceae bacterium]
MKLLIVEDEIDVLNGLAKAFREEGYAVDISADGNEGLYKAMNAEYDAIVLDVMLPGIDGWEILKELREHKRTPVLMLTAKDLTSDLIKSLDGGADDYLTKPFDLGVLFSRVRALIRRSAGQASSTIKLDNDVTINTARRHVSIQNETVSLTAREYILLEYLAQHRGEVVTRTDLYEHLFDEDDSSLSNLLDVHVSNLRKKLGHTLIQTRRGHGYLIE